MNKNIIEKYELIDGYAIIDVNYNLMTANEEMYRFIGVMTDCYFIDIIHEVDLEDFINVANSLKDGQAKDMVLRMKRSDNSYRWMLVRFSRFSYRDYESSFDYFELNISDILALRKQNSVLQNNLLDFRHLLAMENELFFVYDYSTGVYKINNFIDNEIHNMLEMSLNEFKDYLIGDRLIDESSVDEFMAYCSDIEEGKISYSHTIKTNFITKTADFDTVEFRGSTIYKKNIPGKAVGSIRNTDTASNYSSIHTYKYGDVISYDDVNKFCENNIMYNDDCKLSLILMEIDDWDDYAAKLGTELMDRIYSIALQTISQLVGYRGTVCEIRKNLICIAVRDINTEVYLRSFIESLRSLIAWNVRLMGVKCAITYSIGVARYPENGKNFKLLNKKLERALEIAQEKGHNRFIIYKEYLHGEIEN